MILNVHSHSVFQCYSELLSAKYTHTLTSNQPSPPRQSGIPFHPLCAAKSLSTLALAPNHITTQHMAQFHEPAGLISWSHTSNNSPQTQLTHLHVAMLAGVGVDRPVLARPVLAAAHAAVLAEGCGNGDAVHRGLAGEALGAVN